MRFVLTGLLLSAVVMTQAQTLTPSDSICLPAHSPLLLMRHQTFTATCDSMYVINKFRYKLYQQLHRHINSHRNIEGELLGTCEQSLQSSQQAYDQLLAQYKHSDRLTKKLIDGTSLTLKQVNQTLQHTQAALLEAQQQLAHTQGELRRLRRQQRLQKIGIGLGGLGAGLLAGIIVAH